MLGIAAAILLPLYEKQKESEEKKKKKRELMEDYPEIVSKLTVFSGAGLPVRRAWERIVLEYEAACRAGTQTERAADREMAAAYHRMQRGVPELQAYAEFGAGCRLRPYRKLSGLLEQNVRNGAEGLRKALETEMESAFEDKALRGVGDSHRIHNQNGIDGEEIDDGKYFSRQRAKMLANNIGNTAFRRIGRVNESRQTAVSQISNRKSEDKNNQKRPEAANSGINRQKQHPGANGGTEQAKDPNGIFAMPLCGIGISFIDNYIFSIHRSGSLYA